jgi:hypothetical protein
MQILYKIDDFLFDLFPKAKQSEISVDIPKDENFQNFATELSRLSPQVGSFTPFYGVKRGRCSAQPKFLYFPS